MAHGSFKPSSPKGEINSVGLCLTQRCRDGWNGALAVVGNIGIQSEWQGRE